MRVLRPQRIAQQNDLEDVCLVFTMKMGTVEGQ